MTTRQNTDLSPEEKARRNKLERDIETIGVFVATFVFLSVLIWGLYSMAAPFWHLPGASYWEVLGTMGLGYLVLMGLVQLKQIFR